MWQPDTIHLIIGEESPAPGGNYSHSRESSPIVSWHLTQYFAQGNACSRLAGIASAQDRQIPYSPSCRLSSASWI
jgi:hypothetical protein